MYRVRFHLANGKHHRQWQVRHPDGSKTYHDPATTTLVMHHCHLRNSRKVAERIHAGAHKSVCAWVLCRELTITNSARYVWPRRLERVQFNPRRLPHWHDGRGTDLDGSRFLCVASLDRDLFATPMSLIG